ncbi:hypothetical protein Q8A73_016917 [Channa argus]|nr:hypothetical protein Q8A73_016917 [Channa argus]
MKWDVDKLGYHAAKEKWKEAIRADASVRVTLVPGGGDVRVKLSQYADDTTLLLDSDECVVRALELFEDFGRVSGARLNIGKCIGGNVSIPPQGPFTAPRVARLLFSLLAQDLQAAERLLARLEKAGS